MQSQAAVEERRAKKTSLTFFTDFLRNNQSNFQVLCNSCFKHLYRYLRCHVLFRCLMPAIKIDYGTGKRQ